METESKRRRINLNLNDNEDGIDESEDVKMEQFFSLIRKAKDIRDQLLGIEPRRMSERRQLPTKEDKSKGCSKTSQEVGLNKAEEEEEEQHVNIISTTPSKDGRILLDLNLSL
ncbi:uncharacterized protein LOC141647479 [Silene latifolia]|uniref:uncharacterized protein LOC141647479 n=1 Tax=Silene latifolia TaxID=37657 RepID=UPI003D78AF39